MRETPIVPEGAEATDEGESRPLLIRWRAEEWDLIERAAAAFAEREHMRRTTPTDLIRSGALRRAEEILAEAGP